MIFPEGLSVETVGTARIGRLFRLIDGSGESPSTGVVPSWKSWNRSIEGFIKIHEEVRAVQVALEAVEEAVPRKST